MYTGKPYTKSPVAQQMKQRNNMFTVLLRFLEQTV